MAKTNIKTIVVVTIVVVSGLCALYGWHLVKANYITVPGIVVSKSEMPRTARDERRGYHDWYITVKPYNSNYKPYDVPVSFSTYQDYTAGSGVCFKVMSPRVTDNNNYVISVVLFVSGTLVCSVLVVHMISKLIK